MRRRITFIPEIKFWILICPEPAKSFATTKPGNRWNSINGHRGEEKYFPLFFNGSTEDNRDMVAYHEFFISKREPGNQSGDIQSTGKNTRTGVWLYSDNENPVLDTRRFIIELMNRESGNPGDPRSRMHGNHHRPAAYSFCCGSRCLT